ncbi:cation diffusion facilitator family transporter [Sphingoaurantiacus capsulatus]|uniref:Cation diffusion facilitator family transporter n=1 Tax=Sphingoaurantiacus capsulatus TaxID=1771310 RepID=A0ABV7X9C1_9SPHN
MTSHLEARGRLTRRAALASVAMAVALVGLKSWAAASTGSVAMLGSLADSALDLLASLVTLMGVGIAAQPADAEHRFGHGKAEAIAALLQTMLIGLSALAIGWRAGAAFAAPAAPAAPELGIGVSLAAIAATLALVSYQRKVAQATGSLAIHTDQLHYQSDLLLNVSVIAALLLDAGLGLRGADAAFGLFIALYLVTGAARSARAALDMLMDREWPAERRERLDKLLAGHRLAGGVHSLRTRTSGATDFIQFHLWLDPAMNVRDAHAVVDELERLIERGFPHAEILIHVDPAGNIDRDDQFFDTPEPNR